MGTTIKGLDSKFDEFIISSIKDKGTVEARLVTLETYAKKERKSTSKVTAAVSAIVSAAVTAAIAAFGGK